MKCKYCRKGIYDKKTDTVFCNVLGKTLLFDRGDCNFYDEKAMVKRLNKNKEKIFKDAEETKDGGKK